MSPFFSHCNYKWENKQLHIDDLYAGINGHKEEVVEEIQEITLGIATERYNCRVYDISENEDVNVRSIGDTTEDPAALPIIEDMPNNMDEVQKKYVPVALETVSNIHILTHSVLNFNRKWLILFQFTRNVNVE